LAFVSGQAQHLLLSFDLEAGEKAYGLRLSGFSGLTGFVVAGDAGRVEAELDASALLLISIVHRTRGWKLTTMIRKSQGFPLCMMM
jgi:hypothetical protein